jgi:hypothetical protein
MEYSFDRRDGEAQRNTELTAKNPENAKRISHKDEKE